VIYYVTGPLGHGKSFYACKKIAEALLRGRVVATNIRLVEGWPHRILSHAWYYKTSKEAKRQLYRDELRRRYHHTDDIEELLNLRLYGKGENRGFRVIDEAHNELNNRDWLENHQKTSLRKLTLSRKRGWETYFIAQNKDNTDAALRRVAAVEIRLINWRQFLHWPYFRTPMLPFNLFLAQAFPLNVSGNVMSAQKVLYREMFRLTWEKNLYDTMQDYDIPDDEDSASEIWLPLRDGVTPGVTPAGGAPGASQLRAAGNGNGELALGGREPQEVVKNLSGQGDQR